MSRKRVPFLLAGLTTAATMLAPLAAGATEARPRAVDGKTTELGSVRTSVPVSPTGGLKGLAECPEGHHLSPFDMPIYDGLFVVGYETVWFCIPDDLEPAG